MRATEILSEITVGGGVADPISNYEKFFVDAKEEKLVSPTVPNAVVKTVEIEAGLLLFGLYDGDSLESILCVKMTGPCDYPVIETILANQSSPSRGRARALLVWFVENHGPLACSPTHSEEAKKMWQALLKIPYSLKFAILRLSTCELRPMRFWDGGYPDIEEPWDDTEDTVLVALPNPKTIYESRFRKVCRFGLWDGVGLNP